MADTKTSSSTKPQRKRRAKPGSTGEGDYYRIELRPSSDFNFFRNHDVGHKGHLIRVAGRRSIGSWDTVAWLVGKEDAHVEGDTLVADSEDAKQLIEGLGSVPKHIKGDIFEAKDRPNVPERKKPTEAQKKAWAANIKKAQQARWANKKK